MPQAKTKHLTKKKRVRTGLLLSYMVSHIPGPKIYYDYTIAYNKIVPKLNKKISLWKFISVLRFTHQNKKYFHNKYHYYSIII